MHSGTKTREQIVQAFQEVLGEGGLLYNDPPDFLVGSYKILGNDVRRRKSVPREHISLHQGIWNNQRFKDSSSCVVVFFLDSLNPTKVPTQWRRNRTKGDVSEETTAHTKEMLQKALTGTKKGLVTNVEDI